MLGDFLFLSPRPKLLATFGTGDFKLTFTAGDANPLVAVFAGEEPILLPLLPFMVMALQRLSQPRSLLLELGIFVGPLINFAGKDAPVRNKQQ